MGRFGLQGLIFVVLTTISTAFAQSSSPSCEPLVRREGVRIAARYGAGGAAPDGTSTRINFERHRRETEAGAARRFPAGTVVRYGCESPFYVAVRRELLERERRLVCNEHGKWTGGLNRFYLYSCTLNCGVTELGSIKTYIRGGALAKQTDWPWHALIFVRDDDAASESDKFVYTCGGSLVKPYGAQEFVVVTAAHCVASLRHYGSTTRRPADVRIVLGGEESRLEDIQTHSPEAQLLTVREIVMHASYDVGIYSAFQADIALIRLAGSVQLKPNILPICLSESLGRPAVGAFGHLAGFGATEEGVRTASLLLRQASFPVVTKDECERGQFRKLLPQEFCAGTVEGQNACDGDSGSGLVFNGTDENGVSRFYLHGIVSHGKQTCDKHTVFTKVRSYLDWIYEVTEEFGSTSNRGSDQPNTVTTTTRAAPTTRRAAFTTVAPATAASDVDDDVDDAPLSTDCLPLNLTSKQKEGIKFQCVPPGRKFGTPDWGVAVGHSDCTESSQPTGTKMIQVCLRGYKASAQNSFSELVCKADGGWSSIDGGPRFLYCTVECGLPKVDLTGHVVNGVASDPSNWPWNAAIFKRFEKHAQYFYICGATLIGSNALLTAAHCLHGQGPKEDFRVVLAPVSSKFDSNMNQTYSQIMEVAQIHFELYNPATFDANIAVIKTTKPAQISSQHASLSLAQKTNELTDI